MIATPHFKFSVDEYEQMIELGIIDENDRVELIRGEVVYKIAIRDRHVFSVNSLSKKSIVAIGERAVVSVQNPVVFDDSQPEPDLSILRHRDDYRHRKPHAIDVLLLIEVSDTTLLYDREVKGKLYAEAGITEYWIVNLIDDTIEVYRRPQSDGSWGESYVRRRGEIVDIAALPGVSIAVDEVL